MIFPRPSVANLKLWHSYARRLRRAKRDGFGDSTKKQHRSSRHFHNRTIILLLSVRFIYTRDVRYFAGK